MVPFGRPYRKAGLEAPQTDVVTAHFGDGEDAFYVDDDGVFLHELEE